MTALTRKQMLAGAAAAAVAAPRAARAQTTEKVRLCAPPTDDLTPVFWAIKNGSYAKAGLDVEFVSMTSGTAAATAVISGAYELGNGSLIALLLAHLKDLPVAIVGNSSLWENRNPWAGLVFAADAPVTTGADLRDKIVGTPALNDIATLATSVWVDKNGGEASTLKWVEIPGSAAGAAVAAHRVAASYCGEPQLEAALETGKVKALLPVLGAIAPSYAVSAFFARPDWARKNAGLVERFIATTYATAAYTNTHPAETASTIAAVTQIPPAIIAKMTRVHSATSSDPAMIQPPIDVAAKYGYIPRSFPAKELYFR
jgi:NitT/TauT family transport system substrate-binding protein